MSDSTLMWREADFSVWVAGEDHSREIGSFVVAAYQDKFSEKYQSWNLDDGNIIEFTDRQTSQTSTTFFTKSNNNETLTSIRMTERSQGLLPIERDFNLNAADICYRAGIQGNRILEVGRFAKSNKAIASSGLNPRTGLAAVDAILRCAVQFTVERACDVWFASIDAFVLELLRARGFLFQSIGDTVDYLGSPTVPTMLPVQNCRQHMLRNQPDQFDLYFGDRQQQAA